MFLTTDDLLSICIVIVNMYKRFTVSALRFLLIVQALSMLIFYLYKTITRCNIFRLTKRFIFLWFYRFHNRYLNTEKRDFSSSYLDVLFTVNDDVIYSVFAFITFPMTIKCYTGCTKKNDTVTLSHNFRLKYQAGM